MKLKPRIAAALAAAALGAAAGAQEVQIEFDEEALFGSADEAPAAGDAAGTSDDDLVSDDDLFSDDMVFDAVVEKVPAAKAVPAARTDTVRVGGSFSGSAGASWTWTDPYAGNRDPLKPDSSALPSTVSALVFIDARPAEDHRFYLSAKTAWPFVKTKTALSGATYSGGTLYTTETSVEAPNIEVFELFTDFNWQDTLFFRFGKHTVKWGVGYFYSPADVLNVESIDLENPTDQREGPVSLRLHFPVPGTQNNLWLYALAPDVPDASKLRPQDLGMAGKFEFVLGGWEVGAGGFYRWDAAPRAMLTATGSLGKVALFGEAAASWGSDKSFVTDVGAFPGFFASEKRKDELFFSGTAGFSYSNSDAKVSLFGQYYYNGDGYADGERKDLIDKARAAEPILSAAVGAEASAGMLKALILNSGRHYAAASISKTELLHKRLSASVLATANLSDLSGWVMPKLTFEFFSKVSASAGATFAWATDGLWGAGKNGEYVVLAGGPAVTLSLSASLGGGRF